MAKRFLNGLAHGLSIVASVTVVIAVAFAVDIFTIDKDGTARLVVSETDNVGIGTTTPATSAKLDISSTTGAIPIPRMTTVQRNALTIANGVIVYNTLTSQFTLLRMAHGQ